MTDNGFKWLLGVSIAANTLTITRWIVKFVREFHSRPKIK